MREPEIIKDRLIDYFGRQGWVRESLPVVEKVEWPTADSNYVYFKAQCAAYGFQPIYSTGQSDHWELHTGWRESDDKYLVSVNSPLEETAFFVCDGFGRYTKAYRQWLAIMQTEEWLQIIPQLFFADHRDMRWLRVFGDDQRQEEDEEISAEARRRSELARLRKLKASDAT